MKKNTLCLYDLVQIKKQLVFFSNLKTKIMMLLNKYFNMPIKKMPIR